MGLFVESWAVVPRYVRVGPSVTHPSNRFLQDSEGAKVDSRRLYDIMGLLGAGYLVVYQWQAADSPELFEAAVSQTPFLFERRATWPGMSIFERLRGM